MMRIKYKKCQETEGSFTLSNIIVSFMQNTWYYNDSTRNYVGITINACSTTLNAVAARGN